MADFSPDLYARPMRAVIFAAVAGLGVANAQPSAPPPAPEPSPTPAPAPESTPAPSEPEAPPAAQPTSPAEPATPPAPAAAVEPAETAPKPESTPTPAIAPSKNKDIAWLFVGGALTFVTAGAVLAYSTGSSEQDLRDLYVNTNGDPATFDAKTRERYDELVAEGERYERLAWVSFGLAAGSAIGATIYFVRASRERDVRVTPVISPTTAGVRVRF